MEDSELAGITKFVMRDKQHLGALRIRDGIITLEQLYFADEIRPVDEIKASRARVSQQELQMAQQLMESWTTDWKPEKYKDTYRDELCAVIKAKRKGQEIHENQRSCALYEVQYAGVTAQLRIDLD
jgi:DNA end-binding protein Ku